MRVHLIKGIYSEGENDLGRGKQIDFKTKFHWLNLQYAPDLELNCLELYSLEL